VAVLDHEPTPLTDIKPHVPLELQRIVRKALRKDPDQRYQGMKDLLLDLEALRDEVAAADRRVSKPIADEGGAHDVEQAARINGRSPSRWSRALPWMVAAVLGVGVVLVLGQWLRSTSTPSLATQRLSIALGVDGALSTTDAPFTLSPDGTVLAFVARTGGKAPQLYVRRLDQLTATPLSGTEGASIPCFSPDAQWLAFFADSKLKKVPVTGGAVVTLAEATQPRGAWWAEDGSIVFAPHNRKGLMRISSVGGQVQPVTTLTQGEITHRYPQVLPGGGAVLYTASTEAPIDFGSALVVQRLPSGERSIIQRGGYFARYTGGGHIVYMQGDKLFAMPFDLQRLTVTGPAGSTIDGIKTNAARGSAQFALSQTGTMVYVSGRDTFGPRPMMWMDRAGTLSALRAEPAAWTSAEFSPDGRRVALDIRAAGNSDIWVYDWGRDTLTRVTSESTNDELPVWTPDGAGIVYRSYRSSTDPFGYTISWKRADGAGDAQVLVRSKAELRPGSWHPNRKLLAYTATMPGTDADVMILPVEGDAVAGWKAGQPTAFVNGAARERAPTFSPDGRWLSYTSNESGSDQVYVRPFPGPGPRVVVSGVGGHTSSWSRVSHELVFNGEAFDYMYVLMVARYRVENGSFLVDKPRPWAERSEPVREYLGSRLYALHPDGMRVAIAPTSEDEKIAPTHITFVSNLFDEFRRIAPSKP